MTMRSPRKSIKIVRSATTKLKERIQHDRTTLAGHDMMYTMGPALQELQRASRTERSSSIKEYAWLGVLYFSGIGNDTDFNDNLLSV